MTPTVKRWRIYKRVLGPRFAELHHLGEVLAVTARDAISAAVRQWPTIGRLEFVAREALPPLRAPAAKIG